MSTATAAPEPIKPAPTANRVDISAVREKLLEAAAKACDAFMKDQLLGRTDLLSAAAAAVDAASRIT